MAKKNKPSRTPAESAAEQRFLPAVSVIIPMYNTEKYIGECLDSILAQTFQNFEVIVVDDCSTDSSYSIVETYAEKFGGRLKLTKTKANSGGGGYIPRNIGLGLSRGDYIFFVDADDFITKDALEILYTSAENYDSDVVYTSNYYKYTETKKTELERDTEGKILLQNGQEDKPTLTVDDPNKNLQHLLIQGNFRNPWTKFVRRELLIENEIIFPKIFSGGDFIWVIQVYCYSKRFLRIPNVIYFYRNYSSESITRKMRSASEQNSYWVSAFVSWVKSLNKISKRIKILSEQPIYGYVALNSHFKYSLDRFFKERMSLNTQEIYEILYREFTKGNDSFDLTVPFFFSVIDSQQKNLIQAQQQFVKFNQFASQAQKRIAELENEIKRLKGQA